jgi:hypothetical protein
MKGKKAKEIKKLAEQLTFGKPPSETRKLYKQLKFVHKAVKGEK